MIMNTNKEIHQQARIGDMRNRIEEIRGEYEHFGYCPRCHNPPVHFNDHQANFCACDDCRLVWYVGFNLLGSWRSETEADWENNQRKYENYKVDEKTTHYAREHLWTPQELHELEQLEAELEELEETHDE